MSHVVICNWRDSGHPLAGGAELYCERVAEHLTRNGHEVTLLTSGFKGATPVEEATFGRIVRRGGRFTVYFHTLVWLRRHRRQFDAVIDSQNGIPFFSPLATGRRKPVALLIHHVHQHQFTLYFPRPVSLLGQWLERTVSRWVYGRRAVCVVSPSSRAEVRRLLRFAGPVFITACGQDRADNPVRVLRDVHPRIVFVGRLVNHKRVDLLVRAFAEVMSRVEDLRLDIVGSGPELPALRTLADQLQVGERICFHGRVSDQRRDNLLDQAWMTVGTSVGEGWGLSVMEAAARGVPAVALRVSGLQDSVIDGVTGWLVNDPVDLPTAIVNAVASLREDATARSMADACRRWSDRFSWQATADRLLAVLTAERARLHDGSVARRAEHVSDAATIVDLDPVGLRTADLSVLPGTDQIDLGADTARLLLLGADEEDARARLTQMGVPTATIRDCRLARPNELLGWASSVADLSLTGADGESGSS
ncbi:glycosyltransferase family 4 protein [Actinoplanes aureus]|uniref:Glycosyltransferase family 4 protein n=1 Tax=Actinoplanes aureus TaxID=2792083 RepID=A0A931CFN9_9ACTN|nr:glycosyltransferase family 4 protein [Actinoplanes aureus]MBG0565676.1 glycosyltransferase family 4 protein [Actinoplanes aureus]